ncbi:hypothetical protein EG329_000209 [Mollisiaceae sp. DMI_Dod_QoI]|nr:hypothetical protein EG329_000209 [Helotiales sp. DMI_Dod_QoI]
MKFFAVPIIAVFYSACCAAEPAVENIQERNVQNNERDSTGTCSIGIARWFGSISWDVTVYNVPQPLRQDNNIIATLTNAEMDKGQSITIQSPASAITITNVDNAPVFDYDIPELKASISDPATGQTQVKLEFVLANGNHTWSTDDCYAGSVVFSAGLESWSCDFPCSIEPAQAKEL